MWEVVRYSLKERFDMKYLLQVSYLRLQDVISVCPSYCCLSGTTCVPIIVQYITTSLLLTVVHLIQRTIAASHLEYRYVAASSIQQVSYHCCVIVRIVSSLTAERICSYDRIPSTQVQSSSITRAVDVCYDTWYSALCCCTRYHSDRKYNVSLMLISEFKRD